MNSQTGSSIFKPLLLLLTVLVAPAVRADFSNTLQSFHPIGYWPLNETTQPPSAQFATGTNYGTLGSDLNASFTGDMVFGVPGALASTTDSADSFNGFNSRGLVNFRPALSNAPSFTIEAWLYAKDDGTQFGTTCPLSDVEANSPRSGWLIYLNINNIGQYTFRAYNQNGSTASLSTNLGAPGSILEDQWYHLVVVVSNAVTVTNVYGFLNGTLVAGPAVLPSYVPSDGTNGIGLAIGGRTDNDGFDYVGAVDEVAYYTNALDASTVLAHYQAGTNPSPVTPYSTLVLQSHPILYYRLDEVPKLAGPYPVPLPVATNYGSLGSSANGYYQVNTLPGMPGPTNVFGPNSHACQFDPGGRDPSLSGPGVMCAPYAQEKIDVLGGLTLAAWVQVPLGGVHSFQTVLGRNDESYRFDVDPDGLPHFAANPNGDVVGSTAVNDGLWHFWTGVYDPVTNASVLYIDSIPVASSPGQALQELTCYLLVGGAPDYTDRNFVGSVCQVALFTNALSASQIATLYNSAGVAPSVFMPTNQFIGDQNTTVSITAGLSGTPPVGLQWYFIDTGGNTNLATGQTALKLNFPSVQASQNGNQYFLVASNLFGVTTGIVATLTVFSGPPVIQADVSPLSEQVPVGAHVMLCASVHGTAPFSYQWYLNGSTAIAGATNPCYSFNALLGSSTYVLTITNVNGSVNSATATVVGLASAAAPPVITFNGNGSGWTTNGNVSTAGFSNNVLRLTDGTNSEAETAFFNTEQYVGGFVTFFTYNESDGTAPLADGATFCVQNAPAGVNALGMGGGDLGYTGITPSAAFEINIYNGANGGRGVQYGTNGSTADSANPTAPYVAPGSIALGNGDPVNVRLYYDGTTLFARLIDATTSASYTTSYKVNYLPAILGDANAFIGFTAGTGGLNANQSISNFRFSSTTLPVLSVKRSGSSVTISWPASVATFFVLQQSPSLTGPWTNVGTAPTIVSGNYQVTLSASGAAQFYRLMLQ